MVYKYPDSCDISIKSFCDQNTEVKHLIDTQLYL